MTRTTSTARLIGSADWVGIPLTLAAGAAAAGFLSFTPTAYKGLAQLGIIAGFGMVVAYATSLTLLPALIRAVNPPLEPKPLNLAVLGVRGRVPDAPSDCGDRHHRRYRRRRICRRCRGLHFNFDPLALEKQTSPALVRCFGLARKYR